MFSYWYWYFCASAQFFLCFHLAVCRLRFTQIPTAISLFPPPVFPASASPGIFSRMPVNFFPYINLFSPARKYFFSRKEIYFYTGENLFLPAKKFQAVRKPVNRGAFPTRKSALPLLVTLLVFLSFPFISGFIMIIAIYLSANLLIENSLLYQYLLHTKARKNGSPVFIT